ncbi:helix-turn-helix domain-containing protein [Asticcacaulis sp. AC402]|uniref:helix-turn-helix domain-containing protein n=1 Tax=Asticcacaulis sp. AC402 TaxID=1282361 RepID=UPI0003C3E2CF|nr:hypothetical protein ABAC402_05895 [Asticcacaulis sp. AC402]
MAKHNKKGRSKGVPSFVMLRHDILQSEAWRELGASARVVLIQLMSRYRGQNNGTLGASVDALADECRLAPNTVSAALRRLIEVGFIERTREASFGCKMRLAAEYRLTWIKCDKTGKAPSNGFKLWRSGRAANTDTVTGGDAVEPSVSPLEVRAYG